MSDRAKAYWTHDATICVSTDRINRPRDQCRAAWGPGFQSPDWETFNRVLDVLRGRGFLITSDPRIDKHYPSLSGVHRLGRAATPHGDLWFAAETYQTGCKIEFFQEIVTKNPNGGRYDFDRIPKMPYLIRKKYEGAHFAVVEHLAGRGFVSREKVRTATPARPIGHRLALAEGRVVADTQHDLSEAALAFFNCGWDGEWEKRRNTHRFDRGPDGWPSDQELSGKSWERANRSGRRIEHGSVHWTRDRKGYLRRVRVFGGINGMWLSVYGPGARDFTQLSSRELFDFSADLPRKAHPRPQPLDAVLAQAIQRQDFERAIKLRDLPGARKAAA